MKCENLLLSGSWMWEPYANEDTSVLQNVSSSKCRCAVCRQRSERMWTVDSRSLLMLPSDAAKWQFYLQTLIDRDSLQYLNEKRVINWCSGTYTLYPMKTTGTLVIFILMQYTLYKCSNQDIRNICHKVKISNKYLSIA